MKTLQTRNITQPRILKILDVYTYARFKRTPMGKLGRRDQTQPPKGVDFGSVCDGIWRTVARP